MAGANTTYRLLNKVDALLTDFDFSSARKLGGDFAIRIFLRIGASFEPTSIFRAGWGFWVTSQPILVKALLADIAILAVLVFDPSTPRAPVVRRSPTSGSGVCVRSCWKVLGNELDGGCPSADAAQACGLGVRSRRHGRCRSESGTRLQTPIVAATLKHASPSSSRPSSAKATARSM